MKLILRTAIEIACILTHNARTAVTIITQFLRARIVFKIFLNPRIDAIITLRNPYFVYILHKCSYYLPKCRTLLKNENLQIIILYFYSRLSFILQYSFVKIYCRILKLLTLKCI